MNKLSITATALLAGAAATTGLGCQSGDNSRTRAQSSHQPRDLVGTWRASDSSPRTPFSFGSVTFAPDGTYTAEMEYEDEIRANSGGWRTSGNELVLLNPERRYTYRLQGDTLIITDPEHNITVPMRRYSVAQVQE